MLSLDVTATADAVGRFLIRAPEFPIIFGLVTIIEGSRWLYGRTIRPSDDWRRCWNPLIPRRTIDKKWTSLTGQTWCRRRKDGKWEYRQNVENDDEWLKRQF